MSFKLFKKMESLVGTKIEELAAESCLHALEEEVSLSKPGR